MRKAVLIITIILVKIVFAKTTDIDLLEKKFYDLTSKEIAIKTKELIKNDIFYQNAKDLYHNKDKMHTVKKQIGDPEDKTQEPKYIQVKLVDYVKVLKTLRKSFYKYHNPLSAYVAINIYKTKIPAITVKDKLDYRNYMKSLYKTVEKDCNVYIDYFRMLFFGINGEKNIAEAKKVLNESKKCLPYASDWQKNLLDMDKAKIKMLEKMPDDFR